MNPRTSTFYLRRIDSSVVVNITNVGKARDHKIIHQLKRASTVVVVEMKDSLSSMHDDINVAIAAHVIQLDRTYRRTVRDG